MSLNPPFSLLSYFFLYLDIAPTHSNSMERMDSCNHVGVDSLIQNPYIPILHPTAFALQSTTEKYIVKYCL